MTAWFSERDDGQIDAHHLSIVVRFAGRSLDAYIRLQRLSATYASRF